MIRFAQTCKICGGTFFGPRVGGKARGRWLGFDDCLPCREKAVMEQVSARLEATLNRDGAGA